MVQKIRRPTIGWFAGKKMTLDIEPVVDQKNLKARLKEIEHHFESQSDAFYTSGRMMDQGMIDPRETRRVIGFCLGVCESRDRRQLQANTFGIARL